MVNDQSKWNLPSGIIAYRLHKLLAKLFFQVNDEPHVGTTYHGFKCCSWPVSLHHALNYQLLMELYLSYCSNLYREQNNKDCSQLGLNLTLLFFFSRLSLVSVIC